MAKRTPTDPNVAPPPPLAASSERRARARRETAELTTVNERARTSGFWATRQPRAGSAPVAVISTEPRPSSPSAMSTRAPTANARGPGTSDDFVEEVATNVIIDE
ncbi:MAG: hypothetical protein H0T46_16160 [Deltaproteobacteria bacterium]|nr:hypothetical protein [Deltaproteobacteria bacterium]